MNIGKNEQFQSFKKYAVLSSWWKYFYLQYHSNGCPSTELIDKIIEEITENLLNIMKVMFLNTNNNNDLNQTYVNNIPLISFRLNSVYETAFMFHQSFPFPNDSIFLLYEFIRIFEDDKDIDQKVNTYINQIEENIENKFRENLTKTVKLDTNTIFPNDFILSCERHFFISNLVMISSNQLFDDIWTPMMEATALDKLGVVKRFKAATSLYDKTLIKVLSFTKSESVAVRTSHHRSNSIGVTSSKINNITDDLPYTSQEKKSIPTTKSSDSFPILPQIPSNNIKDVETNLKILEAKKEIEDKLKKKKSIFSPRSKSLSVSEKYNAKETDSKEELKKSKKKNKKDRLSWIKTDPSDIKAEIKSINNSVVKSSSSIKSLPSDRFDINDSIIKEHEQGKKDTEEYIEEIIPSTYLDILIYVKDIVKKIFIFLQNKSSPEPNPLEFVKMLKITKNNEQFNRYINNINSILEKLFDEQKSFIENLSCVEVTVEVVSDMQTSDVETAIYQGSMSFMKQKYPNDKFYIDNDHEKSKSLSFLVQFLKKLRDRISKIEDIMMSSLSYSNDKLKQIKIYYEILQKSHNFLLKNFMLLKNDPVYEDVLEFKNKLEDSQEIQSFSVTSSDDSSSKEFLNYLNVADPLTGELVKLDKKTKLPIKSSISSKLNFKNSYENESYSDDNSINESESDGMT